jgi:hypothetical protein
MMTRQYALTKAAISVQDYPFRAPGDTGSGTVAQLMAFFAFAARRLPV